jgi:DNA repair exonuclease SbcCD ATPase subunit
MESRTPEQIANPHIEQIERESGERHNPLFFGLLDYDTIKWAANRQRELDQAEIDELKRQVEELKVELKADYDLINAHRNRISQLSAENERLREEVENLIHPF